MWQPGGWTSVGLSWWCSVNHPKTLRPTSTDQVRLCSYASAPVNLVARSLLHLQMAACQHVFGTHIFLHLQQLLASMCLALIAFCIFQWLPASMYTQSLLQWLPASMCAPSVLQWLLASMCAPSLLQWLLASMWHSPTHTGLLHRSYSGQLHSLPAHLLSLTRHVRH